MGAIAIYLHWLHDQYKLADHVEIDWAQNSSWRKVCVSFTVCFFKNDKALPRSDSFSARHQQGFTQTQVCTTSMAMHTNWQASSPP